MQSDGKAGLRTGCGVRSQVIDVLKVRREVRLAKTIRLVNGCTLVLPNQAKHLIFEDSGIVWIWLRPSSSRESQSFVEGDRGFVIAGDHQQ